jgi:uncharacterized protein (DUF3820 family)
MRNFYNEYMHTKLTFGRYSGYYLKDVPFNYVEWASKNLSDRSLATMFAVELKRRVKQERKEVRAERKLKGAIT